MNQKPNNPQDLDAQAQELMELLDALMEQGSQHVNLQVGEETHVRTVNSTDCSGKGACAIPNFSETDEEDV